MSTILKALRKVERGDAAPPIEGGADEATWEELLGQASSADDAPEVEEPRRFRWPWVGMGALVAVLLVIAGFWWWIRSSSESLPPLPVAREEAPPPVAKPESIAQSAPSSSLVQAQRRVQSRLREADQEEVTALVIPKERTPASIQAETPPAQSLEVQEVSAQAPLPPAPQKQEEVPAVAVVASLPEIHVLKTWWHPDPARRRAQLKVEGEVLEFHEGEDISSKLQVRAIRPTAVVLESEGVSFERRVGNR